MRGADRSIVRVQADNTTAGRSSRPAGVRGEREPVEAGRLEVAGESRCSVRHGRAPVITAEAGDSRPTGHPPLSDGGPDGDAPRRNGTRPVLASGAIETLAPLAAGGRPTL